MGCLAGQGSTPGHCLDLTHDNLYSQSRLLQTGGEVLETVVCIQANTVPPRVQLPGQWCYHSIIFSPVLFWNISEDWQERWEVCPCVQAWWLTSAYPSPTTHRAIIWTMGRGVTCHQAVAPLERDHEHWTNYTNQTFLYTGTISVNIDWDLSHWQTHRPEESISLMILVCWHGAIRC